MNGKNKQLVFGLDTNIFIYHFQNNLDYINQVDNIFVSLAKGENKAITSIITLIELLSFKAEDTEIEKIQDAFQSTPNLKVFPITDEIALKAARIRRKYGYRASDAIQIATALFANADIFITNDKRLQGFNEIKIKLLND